MKSSYFIVQEYNDQTDEWVDLMHTTTEWRATSHAKKRNTAKKGYTHIRVIERRNYA